MTLTCVFAVISFGIVFFRTRPDASVLTSAIVLAYVLYLQRTALSSDEDPVCNPKFDKAGSKTIDLVFGLVFTFLSLIVISGSTAPKDEDANMATNLNAPMMEKAEDSGDKVNDLEEKGKVVKTAEEAHVFPVTTATILFQLLMVLASVYYAMLLTNWGNPSHDDEVYSFFANNNNAYWIGLTAQWVSMIVYLLSLIMPLFY